MSSKTLARVGWAGAVLFSLFAWTMLGWGLSSIANAEVQPPPTQPITRYGVDYDGAANPGVCVLKSHEPVPTSLHVNCKHADEAARIRYRFLRAEGGKFAPADVTVEFSKTHGKPRSAACQGRGVRWMVPTPRTVRVIVPAGCYIHIDSVTWDQRNSA